CGLHQANESVCGTRTFTDAQGDEQHEFLSRGSRTGKRALRQTGGNAAKLICLKKATRGRRGGGHVLRTGASTANRLAATNKDQVHRKTTKKARWGTAKLAWKRALLPSATWGRAGPKEPERNGSLSSEPPDLGG